MDLHRRVPSNKITFIRFRLHFSCFDYVENNFQGEDSIRRIFSLARSFNAETFIREEISARGIIADENNEIKKYFPDYAEGQLLRLSFFSKNIRNNNELYKCKDEDLFGYAILKHDAVVSEGYDRWHVFEAVFKKYPHGHNCIPAPCYYRIRLGTKYFQLPGLLYCQQNALNKACAHVALNSLLSRILPKGEISYSSINASALKCPPLNWKPSDGLNVQQIRKVLEDNKIAFRDVDYKKSPWLRNKIPYQKMAYAGIESGTGALIGFKMAGRGLDRERKHIIPLYGHTFDKDTWVPDADVTYFHIGEGVGYIPSESWTSSYLGHDDNFGPNYSIPRLYVERTKVEYVVELLQKGFEYGGAQAEALGLEFLYSITPFLTEKNNRWLDRLKEWTKEQRVVLRAVALQKGQYLSHLNNIRDWKGKKENRQILMVLKEILPEKLWMVEISTPQLFPANERKLGEIILDAAIKIKRKNRHATFLFARLPKKYLWGEKGTNPKKLNFSSIRSKLVSHTELYQNL